MELGFINLDREQLTQMIESYLQRKKALLISMDGTIRSLKVDDFYFIEKATIENSIRGHIQFCYSRKEFVMAMNVEQDRLYRINKLASFLYNKTINGNVVLLKNHVCMYER